MAKRFREAVIVKDYRFLSVLFQRALNTLNIDYCKVAEPFQRLRNLRNLNRDCILNPHRF